MPIQSVVGTHTGDKTFSLALRLLEGSHPLDSASMPVMGRKVFGFEFVCSI